MDEIVPVHVVLVENQDDAEAVREVGYEPILIERNGPPISDDTARRLRYSVVVLMPRADTAAMFEAGRLLFHINADAPPDVRLMPEWPEWVARTPRNLLDALTAAPPWQPALEQLGVNGRRPDVVCLACIEARAVEWLWQPYLPLGKLTLLDGDPGVGKTFVAIAIGSTLTTAGRFPGEAETIQRQRMSVLYVGAEDDIADTLRPRFDSAGANVNLVHVLRGRLDEKGHVQPIGLADIDVIAATIKATGAKLVVLDPIQAFLGAGVDMHRANETRPLLAALARLAEAFGCAILAIRHLRKSGAGKALYAGLGSIDFAAAARSVLMAGDDPERDGVRVLAHAKCSAGPLGRSITYEIREGRFLWAGPTDVRAEDLCREPSSTRDQAGRDAADFLREELAGGSVAVETLQERAKVADLSWRTVERAKSRLRVVSRRRGGVGAAGSWDWQLPDGEAAPDA